MSVKKEKPNADGYYRVQRVIGHGKDGKPIVKTFRSKRSKSDAKAKADRFMANPNVDINFEEWAEKWLWEYKEPFVRENTFEYTYRSSVENHLIPYFKGLKLSSITNAMVQAFFTENKGASASMLNKFRTCLSQIFDTAIANQIISYNPCSAIKIKSTQLPKGTDTYSAQEVEDIVRLTYLHRFGIYIHILIRMGLRTSELCGLKYEDIDFKNGTMTIQRSCTDLNGKAVISAPKSEKSKRTIPIPQDLLKELKNERRKGYIVISPTGKNVTPRTFTAKRYNTFFFDMGHRRLSPKQMRHTVGTLLYEKCHDIFAVKAFLGHSDIKVTTNVYVHSNPHDLATQLFGEDDDD
jgi:integrase